MAVHPIEINQHIPQEQWVQFFDTFSEGNRHRRLTIELLDQELGDEELIQDAALFNIVYDPAGKGNTMMIETGQATPSFSHTISDPADVWTGQDENGVVLAIRITDQAGNQTIVKLQPVP